MNCKKWRLEEKLYFENNLRHCWSGILLARPQNAPLKTLNNLSKDIFF